MNDSNGDSPSDLSTLQAQSAPQSLQFSRQAISQNPRTEKSFAQTAVQLAGSMARLAGWTPDIFWNATPAEAMATLRGWIDTTTANDAPAMMTRADLAHMMERDPDG